MRADAIPAGLEVPNESAAPEFSRRRFRDLRGGWPADPRLIELQAFPSLYAFQLFFLGCMRKAFPAIPRNWTSSFGGLKDEAYLELLRSVIVADSNPRERDPARDRAGETKDANRFRLHRNAPRRAAGLPDEDYANAARSYFTIATDARCGSSGFTTASFSMS